MKKILVPTDFSSEARQALEYALKVAQKAKAELYLLHVAETVAQTVTVSTDPYVAQSNYSPAMLDMLKEKLENLATETPDQLVPVHREIKEGNPFSVISQTIEQEDIDLVILGSKGASGYKEVLVGSNAERIVRNATCPVLVIKEQTPAEIQNIVFATNMREEQDYVIREIKKLQALFDAKLHLVVVNTPQNFMTDRDMHEMMYRFVKKHHLRNLTLNITNNTMEEDGILYFAEQLKADIIAIGTHGRSGLLHLLSGSLAEDIANHAKRPVWTCRISN